MIIELYIFTNKIKKLHKTCLNPSSMTILLDFLSFFYHKGRCIHCIYEQIKVFDFIFFLQSFEADISKLKVYLINFSIKSSDSSYSRRKYYCYHQNAK